MDWTIKSLAKKCAVSGENFSDGETVVCLILKTPDGNLDRVDILEQNLPLFSCSGTILGRWKRIFSSNDSELLKRRRQIESQEDFFISLYNESPSPEGELMKQLLALLLERKRILKVKNSPLANPCIFTHVRSKTDYSVPMNNFSPEEISIVGNALETLVQ
ncbi:MAG: hypothetical protein K6B46_03905 [Opitutales bacterium]|nr:hypothetical protein [Opitutales bacterium]